MKLGIDFGTTRIVAAAVDRGNYPIVSFESPEGGNIDWFPPMVGVQNERRAFGWEAYEAQHEPGWTIVRSLKRVLDDAGPETLIEIAGQAIPITGLLSGMARSLHDSLLMRSSLHAGPGEPLEVMLGVPANANSNQRFLTAEAFRRAGFQVIGLLNEPSAASIEFGHRNRQAKHIDRPESILVYDLGGGTFDASLVQMDERTHSVVASEGIPALGGDDFDRILAELALDAKGLTEAERDSLSQAEWFRLCEECRVKKEALNPNTRKMIIDLDTVREAWGQVTVPVAAFYERCAPLLGDTIRLVEDLIANNLPAHSDLDCLYVTGGGSELPLVTRALRASFGKRVKRSSYTRSATAIGLAIQADTYAGYVLREKFTRYFGVWREADAGSSVVFDVLFAKGTPLPGVGDPPLLNARRYSPVHDIGHFRYLECSHVGDDRQPTGEIAVWDEIRFPFDPAIKDEQDLSTIAVTRSTAGVDQTVEERYTCDASGTVTVTITNVSANFGRDFRLGRWAGKASTVAPGRKKKKAAKR